VEKYGEEDEDLRKVKDECSAKVISLDPMHTQTITFEEAFQICGSRFRKHAIPNLKLDEEVKDDKNARVSQDRVPVNAARTLLLQQAVAKDADRVNHIEEASLHQRGEQHHEVAEKLTVADESLVGHN